MQIKHNCIMEDVKFNESFYNYVQELDYTLHHKFATIQDLILDLHCIISEFPVNDDVDLEFYEQKLIGLSKSLNTALSYKTLVEEFCETIKRLKKI